MKGTSSNGIASSQRRDAAQQRVEHDLQFSARELLADALMPAVAEAELLAGIAGEVEPVGFGVGGRVPVRRGQVDDDAFAGANGLAADLDVVDGHPALTVLDDRQVAHQLFCGVRDELRIVGIAKERSLFGVLQQGEYADADHVRSRLVAGDQQSGAQLGRFLDADLACGHPFSEVGNSILGGVFHLLLDQVDQVLVEAHRPLLTFFGGRVAGESDVGVVLEELVVLVGDAEHLADHLGRHRQRELGDDVGGLRACQDRVDALIGDFSGWLCAGPRRA